MLIHSIPSHFNHQIPALFHALTAWISSAFQLFNNSSIFENDSPFWCDWLESWCVITIDEFHFFIKLLVKWDCPETNSHLGEMGGLALDEWRQNAANDDIPNVKVARKWGDMFGFLLYFFRPPTLIECPKFLLFPPNLSRLTARSFIRWLWTDNIETGIPIRSCRVTFGLLSQFRRRLHTCNSVFKAMLNW